MNTRVILHKKDQNIFQLQQFAPFILVLILKAAMIQDYKDSTILNNVLHLIKRYEDNPSMLLQVKVQGKPLTLYYLEKTPLYLTDMQYSIQAIRADYNTNETQPRPINKLRSNFYTPNEKAITTMNCLDHQLPPPEFPHPYSPYFHFKQRYQTFINERKKLNLELLLEGIRVKNWSIRLVNIANTGYYAPVLEIGNYENIEPKRMKQKPICNIIYNKQIQSIMEKIRMRDLKNYYENETEKKNQSISLCYYLRNNSKNYKVPRSLTPFIVLDYEKTILNFDEKAKKYFVCTSDIQGICCFMRPLPQKQIQNLTEYQQNYFNFSAVNMIPDIQQLQSQKTSEYPDEMSDIMQQQKDVEQQERKKQQSVRRYYESDSDSQSQEQDLLRKLYRKQIAHPN